MDDLETLRKRTPVDVLELTAVEGIGPKRARAARHHPAQAPAH